jgi:BASS family bile acid:Na+ symporter
MIRFIKNWTLPIAMLLGGITYPLTQYLEFSLPYLIFFMLLCTFCKIPLKQLHLEPLHGWLIAIQVLAPVLVFALLYPFNKLVAEGTMVCVIAPTATAAAVITGKLGGSVPSLTTYTLISSMITAICVPIYFPYIISLPPIIDVPIQESFFASVGSIMAHVFPLLIGPFIAACIIRKYLPKLNAKITNVKDAAFYMWGVALAIVTAVTIKSLVESNVDLRTEILVALGGLVVCCLQFFFGKEIGSIYNNRISGGQALGQKNTIIAIWIALTYLNPIASLGPGSYVLWQNIINSWQLWKKRRADTVSSSS